MPRSVVVILTKNRTEMLGRAVGMITGHHPDVPIIVIDNSGKRAAGANRRLLGDAGAGGNIYHVTLPGVRALRDMIQRASGFPHLEALYSDALRDISGSRNLSLLLSAAMRPETVFCVDDDVVTCWQGRGPCFLDTVESYAGRTNLVIGGRMAGIIDDSYVGRLCRLCEAGVPASLYQGRTASSATEWRLDGHPLWRDARTARARRRKAPYASGGLSAIKVDRCSLLPFPPGYNEDWNWCLLQSAMRGTDILIDGHPSYHSPPVLRSPGASRVVWESLGDVMFYALQRASRTGRRFTIGQLRDFVTDGDSIRCVKGQMTYTINLLDSVITGSRDGADAAAAHKRRLASAARMLAVQDMDAFTRSWFDAQEARIGSFAYMLGSSEAKHVIRAFLDGCAA